MSNDMIAKFVSAGMAEGARDTPFPIDPSQTRPAPPIAATISPRERAELAGLLEQLAEYAKDAARANELSQMYETARADSKLASRAIHWSERLAVKTGTLTP